MAKSKSEINQIVINHLLDITQGQCSITYESILKEEDLSIQEIKTGLLYLFEDLKLKERELEIARDGLENQRQWLEVTLSSIGDAVITTDIKGNVNFMNSVAEKLTGWNFESAQDKTSESIFNIVNEYTRKEVENPVKKVLREGIIIGLSNHTVLIAKDGTELPIDHSGAPIRDKDNNLYGVVLVFRDVTEQKEKEKFLMLQTRQAQMGEMIGMIAHQWRQPLTSITAIAGGMKDEIVFNDMNKDTLTKELEAIETQAQFLSQTINDFRNFYKPIKSIEYVLIKDIILKALHIIQKSFEIDNVRIEVSYESKTKTKVYSNELTQVFLSILMNAKDIFEEKKIQDPLIEIKEYVKENHIIVEISDNAGGIPKDIEKDIFSPYFSTKSEKTGTGLGLYISKTIVEKHCAGRLEMFNTKNGAKFIVAIPIKN